MLKREDIKPALKKLSKELNVDFSKFLIKRLDIGSIFEMKYPVSCYLDCLINAPYCITREYKNESKLFTNNRKTFHFYDKKKQVRKKRWGETILRENSIQHSNLLRMELQLKRVNDILGKLYITDLYEDKNINRLLNHLTKEYKKIKKAKEIVDIDSISIETPKDFNDFLAHSKICEFGKDNTIRLWGKLRSSKKIKTQSYYNYLRKIEEADNKFTNSGKYLEELDEKIHNFINTF